MPDREAQIKIARYAEPGVLDEIEKGADLLRLKIVNIDRGYRTYIVADGREVWEVTLMASEGGELEILERESY